MTSWRTASVSLMSFSSGLPLGLVWIAIPDWMTKIGVDLRVVGLITLAQAPWTFKFLWAPLMDRYVPLKRLGRRRGWIAIAQVALFATTLSLAGVGDHPEAPWVVGALALAVALAAATQDIALDAYAVDVLRPEEQGVAVGARTAIYRAAMYLAGGFSITLAGMTSWPLVIALLAVCYLPLVAITWKAPEPEGSCRPRSRCATRSGCRFSASSRATGRSRSLRSFCSTSSPTSSRRRSSVRSWCRPATPISTAVWRSRRSVCSVT